MIDNKDALVVTIIIFSALAASIRGANYALYCAAVLIAIDLRNPSNLGDEGGACCSRSLASASPWSSCSSRTCSRNGSIPPRRRPEPRQHRAAFNCGSA
jgi:hypothetical protein